MQYAPPQRIARKGLVSKATERLIGFARRHKWIAILMAPIPFSGTLAIIGGMAKDLEMGDRARKWLEYWEKRHATEAFAREKPVFYPVGEAAKTPLLRERFKAWAGEKFERTKELFQAPAYHGPRLAYATPGPTVPRSTLVSPHLRQKLSEVRRAVLEARRH